MIVIPAVGLLFIATGSIWLGSKLGAKKPVTTDEITGEAVDLTWSQVLMLPISSSFFLLLLFFYFAYVQVILVLFIAIGSTVACTEVLTSSIAVFFPSLKGNVSLAMSSLFSLYMVIQWSTNGSYIAHDILGCSICISSIALIRFPSLKLATVCLSLLLLYDVFWVFYSEYFFNKNVMVEVATKSAINPLYAFGVQHKISILKLIQPKLELPIKLMMPSSFEVGSRVMMLGLGDIALPGFLVSLALRCDVYHASKDPLPRYSPDRLLLDSKSRNTIVNSTNLFEYAILGYIFGLMSAFYIGSISGHAQPALIYLVPGVLIPVSLRAYRKGCLLEIWNGPSKTKE